MVTRISDALSAYANTAATGVGPGLAARDEGPSFAQMVRGAAEEAVGRLQNSEQVSAQAALGKADLTDVVTAVSNAEVTLQTVVAVRDRVVSAYQEILRMPI